MKLKVMSLSHWLSLGVEKNSTKSGIVFHLAHRVLGAVPKENF